MKKPPLNDTKSATLGDIKTLAESHGLRIRGSLREDAGNLPPQADGRPSSALLLIGAEGGSLWPTFSHSPEFQDKQADPLDRWSRRIGESMARELDGVALFPFDGPPFHPFISWATEAGSVSPSRLGLSLHRRFGLWHAFRFALVLPYGFDHADPVRNARSACDTCLQTPCLTVCPVSAFDGEQYDVHACYQYLHDTPEAPCHTNGCLARNACPEGAGHRYPDEQVIFHMRQFYQALNRRYEKP